MDKTSNKQLYKCVNIPFGVRTVAASRKVKGAMDCLAISTPSPRAYFQFVQTLCYIELNSICTACAIGVKSTQHNLCWEIEIRLPYVCYSTIARIKHITWTVNEKYVLVLFDASRFSCILFTWKYVWFAYRRIQQFTHPSWTVCKPFLSLSRNA